MHTNVTNESRGPRRSVADTTQLFESMMKPDPAPRRRRKAGVLNGNADIDTQPNGALPVNNGEHFIGPPPKPERTFAHDQYMATKDFPRHDSNNAQSMRHSPGRIGKNAVLNGIKLSSATTPENTRQASASPSTGDRLRSTIESSPKLILCKPIIPSKKKSARKSSKIRSAPRPPFQPPPVPRTVDPHLGVGSRVDTGQLNETVDKHSPPGNNQNAFGPTDQQHRSDSSNLHNGGSDVDSCFYASVPVRGFDHNSYVIQPNSSMEDYEHIRDGIPRSRSAFCRRTCSDDELYARPEVNRLQAATDRVPGQDFRPRALSIDECNQQLYYETTPLFAKRDMLDSKGTLKPNWSSSLKSSLKKRGSGGKIFNKMAATLNRSGDGSPKGGQSPTPHNAVSRHNNNNNNRDMKLLETAASHRILSTITTARRHARQSNDNQPRVILNMPVIKPPSFSQDEAEPDSDTDSLPGDSDSQLSVDSSIFEPEIKTALMPGAPLPRKPREPNSRFATQQVQSKGSVGYRSLATRATVLRNQTFRYAESEAAFSEQQERAPQLYQLFGLISLKPASEFSTLPAIVAAMSEPQGESYSLLPYIVYSYPHGSLASTSVSQGVLDLLPFLCIPDFPLIDHWSRARTPGKSTNGAHTNSVRDTEQFFTLILTDELGGRKFAYCCRYYMDEQQTSAKSTKAVVEHSSNNVTSHQPQSRASNDHIPEVMVFISPTRAVAFYNEILAEAVYYRLKVGFTKAKEFIQSVYRLGFPGSTQTGATVIRTHAAGAISLNRCPSTDYSPVHAGAILAKLEPSNLLMVFAALLCEKRTLIIGNDVPTLARAVQAISTLMYPFEWPHTLIPVIPDCSVGLCLAPTPYLIGTMRFNLEKIKDILIGDEEEFILILDVDYGVIRNVEFKDKAPQYFPKRLINGMKSALQDLLNTESDVVPQGSDGKARGSFSRRGSSKAGSSPKSAAEFDRKVGDMFLLLFVELVGHYRSHIARQQDGSFIFQKQAFVDSHGSKSVRQFLSWFVETGMFQIWYRQRLRDLNSEPQPNAQSSDSLRSPRKMLDHRPSFMDDFDRKVECVRQAAGLGSANAVGGVIGTGKPKWMKQIASSIRSQFK